MMTDMKKAVIGKREDKKVTDVAVESEVQLEKLEDGGEAGGNSVHLP